MALKYIGSVSQHFLAMINTWRISTHSSPIQNFLLVVTVDREKIKEKWLGSENKPTVINVPRCKNYSSRTCLWPLGIHVTTDICLSPQYDWYIALSKISILGFQPLPIQKIFP